MSVFSQVRAKFTLYNAIENGCQKDDAGREIPGTGYSLTVNAMPVYAEPGTPQYEENSKFWKATPSGNLTLAIENKDAWPFFQDKIKRNWPERQFYVTMEWAEEE